MARLYIISGISHSFPVSEIETLQFENWPVEIHRRLRRKNLTICLYPDRPIQVRAARTTPPAAILKFLVAKKSWIEKNIQKFENWPTPMTKEFKAHEEFPFRGNDLKLKPVITLNRKSFVSATSENLLLHIPRDDWSADKLWQNHAGALAEIRLFYKRESVRELEARVKHWACEMKLVPQKVGYREQKTRWGSCSSRGHIQLNWRLIVFSPELMDYVIVHELAHLQHMDHSQNFWNLVARYSPHYKTLKEELKRKQSLCNFLTEKS
jgi:predicted metal-dependent hydrolase